MSFTLVSTLFGALDAGSGSSKQLIGNVSNVQAGDLIVLLLGWDGATTTVSVSDGTSVFNEDHSPIVGANGCLTIRYLLASVATGSPTYTITYGAAREYRRTLLMHFRPSAACTFGGVTGTSGNTSSPSSGNLAVTGSDILAIGAAVMNNITAATSPLVNGAAADGQILTTSYVAGWFKAFAAGYTGAASATLSGTDQWVALQAYFRIGDAGGSSIAPIMSSRLRMMNNN